MEVVKVLFACGQLASLLAYIDPGTGSLAFQALAATLLSGTLFFKSMRGAVLRFISFLFRRNHTGVKPTAAVDESELPRRKAV